MLAKQMQMKTVSDTVHCRQPHSQLPLLITKPTTPKDVQSCLCTLFHDPIEKWRVLFLILMCLIYAIFFTF